MDALFSAIELDDELIIDSFYLADIREIFHRMCEGLAIALQMENHRAAEQPNLDRGAEQAGTAPGLPIAPTPYCSRPLTN